MKWEILSVAVCVILIVYAGVVVLKTQSQEIDKFYNLTNGTGYQHNGM
jgi:hypothetical protein